MYPVKKKNHAKVAGKIISHLTDGISLDGSASNDPDRKIVNGFGKKEMTLLLLPIANSSVASQRN